MGKCNKEKSLVRLTPVFVCFSSSCFQSDAQAALVIFGFAIRSFDYLRTRKQGRPMNNEEYNTVLVSFRTFLRTVLVLQVSEIPKNLTPAKSETCTLYGKVIRFQPKCIFWTFFLSLRFPMLCWLSLIGDLISSTRYVTVP